MKRSTILVFLLAIFLTAPSAFSRTPASEKGKRTFGLGFVLGVPTAITGKYWIDNSHGFDFGLGWGSNSKIDVYADYLVHFPDFFNANYEDFFQQLTPYVGIGGLFHSSKNPYRAKDNTKPDETVFNVILRVPFGVEWHTPKVPLGVFLEVAPGIYLLPDVAPNVQGGVGVRYYF